jgi:hypothetical protein
MYSLTYHMLLCCCNVKLKTFAVVCCLLLHAIQNYLCLLGNFSEVVACHSSISVVRCVLRVYVQIRMLITYAYARALANNSNLSN